MAVVFIFKNTNLGNNDLVWNVPNLKYYSLFDHQIKSFYDVKQRFPLLTTRIVLNGNYDKDITYYDYMQITDDSNLNTYYFINSVIAERGILIFSVTLDVITTFNLLSTPITGVLVRKHDTSFTETRFDYPTALNVEGNFTEQIYDMISYENTPVRFIESSIDLSEVQDSVSIPSNGSPITVPILPKPSHNTEYIIRAYSGDEITDDSRAFTLYNADSVDEDVLNTVRGLSGDGAISDSYTLPAEAVTVTATGAEVTKVIGRFLTKLSAMKLEVDFTDFGYIPKNKAIEGIFNVTITSLQEKTKLTFPAWDLKNSVDEDNYIRVNLWCDPKPSGAPFCCPDQVETIKPYVTGGIINLATLEVKSVRGGQWLRNPLIYSTASGEIFSTVETKLQRERADYEKRVSLQQLEISKRERDIRIAQQDYNYQSGLASSLIGGGMSLASKDFGSAFGQAKGAFDSTVNQKFVKQMQDLQAYEQETEKTLINMAYSNNLKNLNVQENIRRVVPRDVVFQSNESLGSYESYNGFTITIEVPDIQTLKAKDQEYTKYGYPVYEAVENFIMVDHTREKHTVYQFESPLIGIGGRNGDMIREVLQAGIRILNKPYTVSNIMNNPKWNG